MALFPGVTGGFTGGGASGGVARSANTGDITFNNSTADFFKKDNSILLMAVVGSIALGALWMIKK